MVLLEGVFVSLIRAMSRYGRGLAVDNIAEAWFIYLELVAMDVQIKVTTVTLNISFPGSRA